MGIPTLGPVTLPPEKFQPFENLSYSLSASGILKPSTAICILVVKLKIGIVESTLKRRKTKAEKKNQTNWYQKDNVRPRKSQV